MARLVILGGGIAGQTAAPHAKTRLDGSQEVLVVTPNSLWNWTPSNIRVGVGVMQPEQVTFPLAPVYKKTGITYYQAKAVSIHPEGDAETAQPFVTGEHPSPEKQGQREKVTCDYLINATGPKLNFDATPGLGPLHNSQSVGTFDHAAQAAKALDELVARMERGEKKTIVIGTGHGTCTCQGAAFEYLFNVEFGLRQRKVRPNANLIWISNEQELGDFGIGGRHVKRGGDITRSRVFTESLYTERGVKRITRAHVKEVGNDTILYEDLDGNEKTVKFDFAMLPPPFAGVGLKAFDQRGRTSPPRFSPKADACSWTAITNQSPTKNGCRPTGQGLSKSKI